jgi:hypothetical protein
MPRQGLTACAPADRASIFANAIDVLNDLSSKLACPLWERLSSRADRGRKPLLKEQNRDSIALEIKNQDGLGDGCEIMKFLSLGTLEAQAQESAGGQRA